VCAAAWRAGYRERVETPVVEALIELGLARRYTDVTPNGQSSTLSSTLYEFTCARPVIPEAIAAARAFARIRKD
jgi:hypothetical protein